MGLIDSGLRMAGKRMPKMISPRGHAIADYLTAAGFLAAALVFWKRNRRAAVAALTAATLEAGTAIITDYPGGMTPVISFPTHGKIDAAGAGLIATLPSIMDFDEEPEANLFRTMSVATAAITGMTDFEAEARSPRLHRAA